MRFKLGKTAYKITLWSLICGQLNGERATYRRVKITQKVVYISEEEHRHLTDCNRLTSERGAPATFPTWKLKTLTNI